MPQTAADRRGPFREGEFVLLVDFKGRRYLTQLAQGDTFYTHMGHIAHEAILGGDEGSWVATNSVIKRSNMRFVNHQVIPGG